MKKIRITSTHRPVLVTTPNRSKTLIVAGTIVEVNGEEWNHPYCAIMPGGAITLDDIEWEYAWEKKAPVAIPAFTEHMVNSSDGKKLYRVLEYGDGTYTCSCDGFKYRKNCRHINEI